MTRPLRSLRRPLASLVAAGVVAVGISACTPDPNPPWPASGCNANVAILIDRSSSIGDPAYGGSGANVFLMKGAVKSMIDRFAGTNVHLYIGAFATNADWGAYQLWGGGYSDVPYTQNPFTGGSVARAKQAVDNIPFGTVTDATYGTYSAPAGVGRGRTNWYGALKMVPPGANLVVLVTDGDPTWYDGADPATNGTGVDQNDIDMAIGAANDLKKTGARVVAVHFGAKNGGGPYGGWEGRVQGVTYYTPNADYWPTGYDGLSGALNTIAANGCVPTPTAPPAPAATTPPPPPPVTTAPPPPPPVIVT